MGPFDIHRQRIRAQLIEGLLQKNPQLSPEMKLLWQNHLDNLAFTEDEYNARVIKHYSNFSSSPFIDD